MLTLPNILTLSRIFTVPVLVWLLWWPEWQLGYGFGFGVYALMGITDYFDGYLARAQGTVSKLGVFLDPIADKIMVAAVILVLTAKGVLTGPYVGELHVVAGLVIMPARIFGRHSGVGAGVAPGQMEDDAADHLPWRADFGAGHAVVDAAAGRY